MYCVFTYHSNIRLFGFSIEQSSIVPPNPANSQIHLLSSGMFQVNQLTSSTPLHGNNTLTLVAFFSLMLPDPLWYAKKKKKSSVISRGFQHCNALDKKKVEFDCYLNFVLILRHIKSITWVLIITRCGSQDIKLLPQSTKFDCKTCNNSAQGSFDDGDCGNYFGGRHSVGFIPTMFCKRNVLKMSFQRSHRCVKPFMGYSKLAGVWSQVTMRTFHFWTICPSAVT